MISRRLSARAPSCIREIDRLEAERKELQEELGTRGDELTAVRNASAAELQARPRLAGVLLRPDTPNCPLRSNSCAPKRSP